MTNSVTGVVGPYKNSDYYSFVVNGTQQVTLDLSSGSNGYPSLALLDSNGNSLQSASESTSGGVATDGVLSATLTSGTYYAVVTGSNGYDTNFNLSLSNAVATVGGAATNAGGGTLSSATSLGTLSSTPTVIADYIGGSNPYDYYSFNVPSNPASGSASSGLANYSALSLSLAGLTEYTRLYLLNASGQTIQSWSAQASGGVNANVLLPYLTAGTYYIEIVDQDSSGGSGYNLSLSAKPVTDKAGGTTAAALSVGQLSTSTQTFTDQVDADDPTDDYAFTVAAPSHVNLNLHTTAGGASITLENASGGQITSVQATPNSDGEINADLPPLPSGTYFVSVQDNGTATTPYTLSLAAAPIVNNAGVSPTTATALSAGSTVTGYDGDYAPNLFYAITLTQATTINLRLVAGTQDAPKNALSLALLNSGQTKLAASTAFSNGNALVTYAAAPGTYYVEVSQYNSGTSLPYSLTYTTGNLPSGSSSTATNTAVGTATKLTAPSPTATQLGGYVSSAIPNNWYSFTLTAPEAVEIDETNPTTALPSLTLTDVSGTNVLDYGEANGSYGDSSITARLGAGTYYIHVAAGSAINPIAYDLAVSGTTLPINGGSTIQTADNIGALGTKPVTLNGFTGTSSSPAPSEYYQFTLSAASTVSAILSGIDYAALQLRLLNVSGQTIQSVPGSAGSFLGSNGSLSYNLAAGTYFFDVAGDSSNATDYTLTAQATPLADNGGTSISTASVLGSVGQASSYSIAATSANQADGTTGTTPYTFTVTRTGDTSQASTINYAVAGSAPNAAPSSQFQNTAGYVTFAAGATTATITVNVVGGSIATAEGFTVTISPGNNVNTTQIGTATAIGTIGANTTASQPTLVNNSDGTSYVYAYNPSSTVLKTASKCSGANGSGSLLGVVVNNGDATTLVYAYNPTSTVKQTATRYASTNADGTPGGAVQGVVVDNTDGTSLVYAYNPTSTVKQTATKWSATNADGSAAGTSLGVVVDNTDGTSLAYAYNPISGVKQTATRWSSFNSDGSTAGISLGVVLDNSNGSSVVYAYNPTSGITQTATSYASSNADGSPAGAETKAVIDYAAGGSTVTTYNANGTSSTVQYSGPDGTGSVVQPNVAPATGGVVAVPDTPADGSVATISGLGQVLDPGMGSDTIQFASGAGNDTLVLHPGGAATITGFDPAAGDRLDVSALLGDTSALPVSAYFTVGGGAGSGAILFFDPAAQGGGSLVAIFGDTAATPAQIAAALIRAS